MLVPLLTFLTVALGCYAGFVKLGARILHYQVSWRVSLLFALGALGIVIISRLAPVADLGGRTAASIVQSLFCFIFILAFGAWFFSDRATDAGGAGIGYARAVGLVGLAFGIMLVVAFIVVLPARAFLSTHLTPPP